MMPDANPLRRQMSLPPTVVRRRLRRVRVNRCPACRGDGFGPLAMHVGHGIWLGEMCPFCDGTGRRK